MEEKEKWTGANWFIDRLQFELFVICVLWTEEYIDLTTVLNEIEQRNELYIPGALCEEKRYMKFLTKKNQKENQKEKCYLVEIYIKKYSKTLGQGT